MPSSPFSELPLEHPKLLLSSPRRRREVMGACASKPKELNGQCPEELRVVATPAPDVNSAAKDSPKEAMVKENKEEPLLVNLSEAKPEEPELKPEGESLAPEISELKLEVPEKPKKEDEAEAVPVVEVMAESEAAVEKVEEPAAEEKESKQQAERSEKKE